MQMFDFDEVGLLLSVKKNQATFKILRWLKIKDI